MSYVYIFVCVCVDGVFVLAVAPTAIMCWLAQETIAHLEKWAWSYHEPDPADTGGLLGCQPATLAMCLSRVSCCSSPCLGAGKQGWGQQRLPQGQSCVRDSALLGPS